MATKTYSQLTKELEILRIAAEKQLTIEKQAAVERLNKVIAEYGLTANDLKFGAGAAETKSSAKKQAVSSKADVKFADATGNTWSGRGPRPVWLRAALASGQSLESFASAGAKRGLSTKKTKSATSPAKAPVTLTPAKYAHPKTGASWTGRGPKPHWLKQALKKRGSRIEDFLTGVPNAAPAAEPTTTASARTAKAIAKTRPSVKVPKAVGKSAAKVLPAKAETPAEAKKTAKALVKPAAKKVASPARKTTAKSSADKVGAKMGSKAGTKTVKPANKNAPVKRAVKSLPAKANGAAKAVTKISSAEISSALPLANDPTLTASTPGAPPAGAVPETAGGS
jgi:DNA-binding protein H-NS